MEDPKNNNDETKEEQVKQELSDTDVEGVDGGGVTAVSGQRSGIVYAEPSSTIDEPSFSIIDPPL